MSPGGTPPTLDEVSDDPKWFDDEAEYERAKQVWARDEFTHPGHLEDLTDAQIEAFDAVFIPGGHAPLNDLHANGDVARILRVQHEANKLTGAICHGTSALLAPASDDQPWIYAGYSLTGYSGIEEDLSIALHYVGGLPKVHLEAELRAAGGLYSQSVVPFTGHVVRDGELLTGEDPQSTKQFAEAFVDALAPRSDP